MRLLRAGQRNTPPLNCGIRRQQLALLRIVVSQVHRDSGVNDGIFDTAYALRDSEDVIGADRQALADLLAWFAQQLPTPERFNRSSSKGYDRVIAPIVYTVVLERCSASREFLRAEDREALAWPPCRLTPDAKLTPNNARALVQANSHAPCRHDIGRLVAVSLRLHVVDSLLGAGEPQERPSCTSRR